jgi:hypothetical protein
MKDFTSLLLRIGKALGSDTELKDSVCAAVHECVGGNLKRENIKIKEGVLTLTASPALKSEICLKEEKIIVCIKEKCGTLITKIVYC